MSTCGIPGCVSHPEPVPEPVPKEHQAAYVTASQDLHWLSEHGALDIAARFLAALRRETEQEETRHPKWRIETRQTAGGETRTFTSEDGRTVIEAHLTWPLAEDVDPLAGLLQTVRVIRDGTAVTDLEQARRIVTESGLIR